MGQEGGVKCIWVRGGLTYYVVSNITPTLKTANYTNGNEIFTTGTTLHGGTNTKVTVYWTPQSTSGLGTLYHSGGLALGGGLSINGAASLKSTLSVTDTSNFTGAATFNGGLTSTRLTARALTLNNLYTASLSSAGWYRFATSTTANNSGGTAIFFIRRNYYNSNNESWIIAVNYNFGEVTWKQLCGSAKTQLITNVRCTYTNNSTMYFDLYYSGTVANNVYVNCIGTATCQTPTATTSTLTTTSSFAPKQYAIGDNMAFIRGRSDNPLLCLTHTYNSTEYVNYVQAYQGQLMMGAGSSKSLKIDASGNVTAVGEVTAHSDKRLKDNIKPLSVRGELNPVTYTKDGKESIGFIADEVKEFYPELVVTDDSTDEKYLSLNYGQLTAVLYAEIKELKKEINELKSKIQ